MFREKQKGFTLVELLIVVAVIGILATILIVSLRQASDRSRNTKIITNVVQVRKIAEQMYAEELTGYEGLCQDSTHFNSEDYPELGVLQSDIVDNFGGSITCYDDSDSYCVSSSLRTAGRYICIDDEGSSVEVDGNPCTAADDTCQ